MVQADRGPAHLGPGDQAALQVAATSMLNDLGPVADLVSEAILKRQHDLVPVDSPEAVAAVYRAANANITAILSTLAGGIPVDTLDVPDGALDLLDHVAVELEALPVMLRAYRLGAADFTQQWLTHLAAHVDDVEGYTRLARTSLDHVATYVDRISEVIVSRWTVLIDAAVRSGRRRRATVVALLDGGVADPSHLEHPVSTGQLVVGTRVLPGDTTHATSVARSLDGLGAAERLTVDLAESTTLHWIALPHPIPPAALTRTLAALPNTGWAVVTTAPPGLDFMVAAGRDVRKALAVLPTAAPDGMRTVYADIALLCSLLTDERAARRTAQAILGPLAEPTVKARRLRETLHAYFSSGERKTSTAATLHIHEKTVGHRLRQVEDLLGPDFYVRRTNLEVALLIDRSIGLTGGSGPPPPP